MWIIYLIIGAVIFDFIADSITDNIKKMSSKEDSLTNKRLDNIEQYLMRQSNNQSRKN